MPGSDCSGQTPEAPPFAGGCESRLNVKTERGCILRFDAEGDRAGSTRPQVSDRPCEERLAEAATAPLPKKCKKVDFSRRLKFRWNHSRASESDQFSRLVIVHYRVKKQVFRETFAVPSVRPFHQF